MIWLILPIHDVNTADSRWMLVHDLGNWRSPGRFMPSSVLRLSMITIESYNFVYIMQTMKQVKSPKIIRLFTQDSYINMISLNSLVHLLLSIIRGSPKFPSIPVIRNLSSTPVLRQRNILWCSSRTDYLAELVRRYYS